MKWRLNDSLFNEACDRLDLKLPVKLESRRLPQGVRGVQGTKDGRHLIGLDPIQIETAEQANKTLLHELCHCVQREHLGDDAEKAYALYDLIHGYSGNPLEQQANEFADEYARLIPLVEAA